MPENNNKHTGFNGDNLENPRITYHQFGFRSANYSNSRPEAVDGFLDNVYEKFLDEQKLDENGLKDRIAILKAEVQQEKEKKGNSIADLASTKSNKEDKEREIHDLELEKIEIKKGDGEVGGTLPFVIGAFITLLLTLYLFVFYSSSSYTVFYGVKPGASGFINSNVFTDALNKGPGAIALVILFPVIFLGLGFLIHDTLENNKKLASENKPSKYALIISLILVTFIADAFVGYKISEGVYANNFNIGLTNDTWNYSMIFSDVNFYIVLVLGFVVYLIWGLLLHFVLSHPYLKSESERVKLLIEFINNKISEKRKELNIIVSKINNLESAIVNCDNKIKEKEVDIIGYQNGVIPINVASLKGAVGEFMGGWQAYSHGNFDSNTANQLIGDSIRASEKWLEIKIKSLNTER
jgi:cell division septum initiation protein DivIVA